MRVLPDELQARLQSGVTTLAWCWRITPRDRPALGFTDHDRDLVFDGSVFEAASGLSSSEIKSSVGLAVDNLEVVSALVSERLSEAALAAGDFDDATVEIFRVDWSDPSLRLMVRRGSLGEVRRSGSAFTAEVRGLSHYLQQTRGRIFQFGCDADLGDSRCGVSLDDPAFSAAASVVEVRSARLIIASGLGQFVDGWLTRGSVRFTSGANAGRIAEIRRHSVVAGVVTLELWTFTGQPLAPGDAFVARAGCDKQFTTCRAKFANAVNYRGFPHMPGNDFLASPTVG
jgi:uncharacterized phage protein (TIGR02218 family)